MARAGTAARRSSKDGRGNAALVNGPSLADLQSAVSRFDQPLDVKPMSACPTPSTRSKMRSPPALALAVVALLAACEVIQNDPAAKQDTATAAAGSLPDSTAAVTGDTLGGVPAVASDSALSAARASDTGAVRVHPARPRRGGVLFAIADGLGSPAPNCYWKNDQVPCFPTPRGVMATIPLAAEEPAGSFALRFERPGPASRDLSITKPVNVADHEFEREIIFLDSARYALLAKGSDIARDARALRQVLSSQSRERQWTGKWREPVTGGKSSEHGVERFYYRASDSSRAVSLPSSARASAAFAGDTAARRAADVPAWRHSGVDIAVRRGTAVVAPARGTVAEVGEFTLTGRTLIIDHGRGVHSAYFHLDTVVVRRGDVVPAGRTIARVGSTGLSTGPHLHYGIYINGKDVDPAAWRDMPEFLLSDSVATTARR